MTFRLARAIAAWSVLWSLWGAGAACNSARPDEAAEPRARMTTAARPTPAPVAPDAAPAAVATRPVPATMVAEATRPAGRAAPTVAETERDLRQIVAYLASDELEGRGVGTKGIDLAADYIAERFGRAGLEPLPGLSGYFQPFPMTLGVVMGENNALSSGDRTFTIDEDYRPLSFSAPGEFDGPLAFVGYAIASERYTYDDFERLDVKGKVVLALRFEPHTAEGKSRFTRDRYSSEADLRSKADAAAQHGAAALLLVTPPTYHKDDGLRPFAQQYAGGSADLPVINISIAAANELLAKAGAPDLAALQARIDETGRPASQALGDVRVAGRVDVRPVTSTVKNVAGVVRGSGRRADEFVVVGAHYDHIGRRGQMGTAEERRQIHNGADDNASGTAALIALAERFAQSGPHERSIVFVAFTAEESGLIGSKHFVDHPPVPLDRVVAMMNLDMVGRARDAKLYVGGAGTAAGLEGVLKRADAASPLEVKDIGKGGLGPSDHMSFALKKIPVLFLFTGLHSEYHRPADDADRVNYEGLAQVVEFTEDVVGQLVSMPRQSYVSTADVSGMRVGSPGGSHVTLGVVPSAESYTGGGPESGVQISGTVTGSPAEAAGLVEGDVIVGMGEKPVRDIYDLMAVLAERRPGDKVTVRVRRGETELPLEATLAERKGSPEAMAPGASSPHGGAPHDGRVTVPPTHPTTVPSSKG